MKITILTIFPEMFEGFLNTSIIKKARLKHLIDIEVVDFRAYSKDHSHRVDDYPYGGGAGMVLMCQPVLDALKEHSCQDSYILLTSPTGAVFNQQMAHQLMEKKDIVIICGHYEGYDARIYDYADQQVSIGDYILTGGELPAMVITDTLTRLVDGVIAAESLVDESFENGLLEYNQYTRPEEYDGKRVPEILLSGHHENIRKYRLYESLKLTYLNRPDLLENRQLTKEEERMLDDIKLEIAEQNAQQ
ncbi:MAG: tRNA (guanosine(37)-N1)-methyltransferase TrmD [Erysipelotrichaceae bacterium]|nr:tRNA (guanosine(37)-N1)-methyltransferase TrmD [Erysipelotrichaceae bacterium]